MKFSVNVLCYKDSVELARRCLGSIVTNADWNFISGIRIGGNALTPELNEAIYDHVRDVPVPVWLFTERNDRNVFKYPLMRRMFYSPSLPLAADRVMWFDDDSYLKPSAEFPDWWATVAKLAEDPNRLIGSGYRIASRKLQSQGINAQPWCTTPVKPKHVFHFPTGGWWVADPTFLRRWNYPFPVLQHNGGDSILGELYKQQGFPFHHFNWGVAINADARGNESRAPRRGLSTIWPWEEGPGQDDKSHHDFECVFRPLNDVAQQLLYSSHKD